jgi:16S rRNA G527 N7-methylase RsmG
MRWVDVGSGAGMPGLIVAAVTEAEVILAEPRQRRAAFLEFAGRALGCGQMRVWRARWDGSTWDERGVDREIRGDSHEFSVASSRAVWGPSEWLKVGRKLIGVNGAVVVHCPHVSKLPGNRGWSGVTEPVGGKLGVVVAFRK